MSIGEFTMSEAAVSEQPETSGKTKPPPKRLVVAKADGTLQPEAR